MEKIACGGFVLGDGLTQTIDENGQPILNAQGGGDTDEFVIKFTSTQVWQQPDEWTCDRTFEEYVQAINDNKPIKVLIQHWYNDSNEWHEPTVITTQNSSGLEWRYDVSVWLENGNYTALNMETMLFDEDGMLYKVGDAVCLPHYSSADEGKSLKINDGQPTWATGGGGFEVVGIMDATEPYKTPTEVAEMIKSGKIVMVHYFESEYHENYMLYTMLSPRNGDVICYGWSTDDGLAGNYALRVEYIGYISTDVWEYGTTIEGYHYTA